jgi:hypothetical protein
MKLRGGNPAARFLNCFISDVHSGYRAECEMPLSEPAIPTADFQNPRSFKIKLGDEAENLIAPVPGFLADGLLVLRIPAFQNLPRSVHHVSGFLY